MGTTCWGDRGEILGWVNVDAIQRGMVDPVFNNFGGEERFWFAPEGGQFGLCKGKYIASPEHYHVPDAFNTQPFKVLSKNESSITMHSCMRVTNASGTRFQMGVTRRVRILDACPYTLGFGKEVNVIGFETDNTSCNTSTRGCLRNKGALAMFCLTQFPTHHRLVAIVPFRKGTVSNLGPRVRDDYFPHICLGGRLPAKAWRLLPNVGLFKVDGSVKGKIGVARQRAIPRLGSWDLDRNELIIMDFDFYPELEYAASYWYQQENPYEGDVCSLSYEGPGADGNTGQSYELESLSPALFLKPGQSFGHRNRVYHLFGPTEALDGICNKFLGVERKTIEEFEQNTLLNRSFRA